MAINRIQFQAGLSLPQFQQAYGTEAQCEAALKAAKWPNGFQCPLCQGRHAFEFMRGRLRYWQCNSCRHQTTLIAGTLLQHTQMPLTTWFLALYLMTQAKTNISALALKRHLGVSWKTAWLLRQKVMEAMYQREQSAPLSGDVSVDDAYLGGELTGGKAGRGSQNKVAFVAAVEMREGRPARVRFDTVAGFSYAALSDWASYALAPGCAVTSDGLIGFEVFGTMGFTHHQKKAVRGKAGCEVEPFKWLNTVLGNLKTALSGTHHAFNFAKYAHRYLADVQYRFNRRFNLTTLLPRLLNTVVRTSPCPKRIIQFDTEKGT